MQPSVFRDRPWAQRRWSRIRHGPLGGLIDRSLVASSDDGRDIVLQRVTRAWNACATSVMCRSTHVPEATCLPLRLRVSTIT
jgi:hypothetical protein